MRRKHIVQKLANKSYLEDCHSFLDVAALSLERARLCEEVDETELSGAKLITLQLGFVL